MCGGISRRRRSILSALLGAVLATIPALIAQAGHGDGATATLGPASPEIWPAGLDGGVPLRNSFDPDEKVIGHRIIEHGVRRDELMPIYGPESAPVGELFERETTSSVPEMHFEGISTRESILNSFDARSLAPRWPIPQQLNLRKMAYPFRNEDWK